MTSTSFSLPPNEPHVLFFVFKVRRAQLHSILRELRRRRNKVSVDKDHGTAIVVQSVAIALEPKVSSKQEGADE